MMRPGLKAIRNADSEAALQEKWNDFQRRFAHAKELIAYIKTWMEPERLAKWALYQRENNQHINTNNLVESWHKTCKRQYLGYKRDLRPDDLIFLLQGTVDIDYRTSYYRISRGLQPLTLSEAALARRAKAMALPFVDAKDMVSEPSQDGKCCLSLTSARCIRSIQTKICRPSFLAPAMIMIGTKSLASICILYQGSTAKWRSATTVTQQMKNFRKNQRERPLATTMVTSLWSPCFPTDSSSCSRSTGLKKKRLRSWPKRKSKRPGRSENGKKPRHSLMPIWRRFSTLQKSKKRNARFCTLKERQPCCTPLPFKPKDLVAVLRQGVSASE
ncbi:hypothetical protein BC939DRAFT_454699 [Gamsiella multidivaricata]|uniref:uncharacterized protein n=1 Tax=Gamsiella multidivaricata TaxID=101098 RepID=UPI00221FD700|nr:uncharacterized protein BC939DRAFT_454699 [Gamsiella multidivaricata]KAI7821858.1 hypothetical protein BC939DRAFT_454699 [Gamsiella multidivaricata]